MDGSRRPGRLLVGIALVISVFGTSAAVAPPLAAKPAAAAARPSEPQVEGQPVPRVPPVAGAEDAPGRTPPATPEPRWPVSGSAEIALAPDAADTAALTVVGSYPVAVAAGPAGQRPAPSRVRVQVLGADDARRLGGVGLGIRVTRADGGAEPGPVRVALDYSGFAHAYGGGFADRLRLVRLPGCVLDGPPPSGARSVAMGQRPAVAEEAAATGCALAPERVPAVNDPANRRLVADVEAGVPGDGDVLVVQASSTGTFSGNYAATDLAPAGKWQVGVSSGAFTYSYPIPEPPTVSGEGPNLAFAYSSSAVDGVTAASNHQSGWTGLGWTLSPGFIERRYKPCADDASGTGKKSDQKNWGHLCWESPDENDGQAETSDPTNSELFLSLDGKSSRIVRDRLTGAWKTQDDFGWRIEYLTGGASGQPYWVVTTQDGKVHRFGYRRDSMWQVPFAGDDPGEPCNDRYANGGTKYPGMCQGPWRWNHDQTVDANENVTTLYWKREESQYRYYAREVCCSSPPTYEYTAIAYDRGGYLDYIEWGANQTVAGSRPTSKMVFNMVSRCSDTTTRDDPAANPYPIDTGTGNLSCTSYLPPYVFWDVPDDLMTCTRYDCPGTSPAFYIVRRLDSIVTYSYDPVAGAWEDTTKIQLRFKYVISPENGTNGCCTPALWLDYLRPIGLAGSGELRLPPVDFDAVELNGRVDYGMDGWLTKPRAILPRIGWVHNGLGGRLDVSYGRANACPDGGVEASGYYTWYNGVQWDRHGLDCFRTYDFWLPSGGGSGVNVYYGVYHKYLVTKVVEKDVVAASPDVVTAYEYLDTPAWAFGIDYLGTRLTTPYGTVETSSWSEFRGYPTARVVKGSGTDPAGYTVNTHSFFRGLYDDTYADGTPKRTTVTDVDGNAIADRRWLAGRDLQQQSWRMTAYQADPAQRQYAEMESTRYEYEHVVTGDGPGVFDPGRVNRIRERHRELRAGGGFRYTDERTAYDEYGLPVRRNDYGEDGVADNTCTATTYARNLTLWLVSYQAASEQRAGDDCATGAVIGRTAVLYDGSTDPGTNLVVDGNATEVRTWIDPTSMSVSKQSFDDYGRVVSTTDPAGHTTTTTYSPAVNWPTSGVTAANPAGHRITTWTSRLHGQTTKVLDVDNGRSTEVDYDQLGRTVTVWGPGEPRSGGTPTTTFTYAIPYNGSTGQPTAAPRTTRQQLLSGGGSTAKWMTAHAYDDGWGRDREVQAPSPSGGRIVAVATYDGRGLPLVSSTPVHNSAAAGSGLLNPAASSLPAWTRHDYDGTEKQVVKTDQNYSTELRRTTINHLGAEGYSVVPPAGGATEYWSDAKDRLTRVVEWAYWGVGYETRYEYDLNGNLTRMVDANGNVRTFTYDWAGRRLTATDPDSGTTRYGYDAAGRLTSTLDDRGQKITTSYDALGRRTALWSGEAGTGTKLAEWRYDTLVKGQLTSSTSYVDGNAYVDEVLAFDANDRPVATRLTLPAAEGVLAGTYDFTAGYDKAGHLVRTGMPAAGGLPAETVTATFNDQGYAFSLTSDYGGGFTYVKDTTYSASGKPIERRYGAKGQVKRSLTWDLGTNRLTNVTTLTKADTATPVRSQDDDLHYDANNNVTRIVDKTAIVDGVTTPQSECFNYDQRNRLIFAWTTTQPDCSAGWWYSPDWKGPDPYWRSYTYDPVGNITSQDTAGRKGDYIYPAAGASAVRPNAVTEVRWPDRTDTYAYDAAGHMTSRDDASGSTTYEWDALGRMARSTTGGQITSMVYDADGERLLRREPGRTTLYLGQMELELKGGQVSARRYYSAGDGVVVAVRSTGTASVVWLLGDPQRSEQLAVDDATARVDRQRYLPFGGRRGGRDDITATERGFLGKIEDPTTGLVHLGARYYDPNLGKFVSGDPVLEYKRPQLANPYSYAGNSPPNMTDSEGLTPCSPRDSDYKACVEWERCKQIGKAKCEQEQAEKLRKEIEKRLRKGLKDALEQLKQAFCRAVFRMACPSFSFEWKNVAKKALAEVLTKVLRGIGLAIDLIKAIVKLGIKATMYDVTRVVADWAERHKGVTCENLHGSGMLVCHGLPSDRYPRGGITIANVFLTGKAPAKDKKGLDLLEHEKVHRTQWQRYADRTGYWFAFAIEYAKAGSNPCTNRFEIEANLRKGNYTCP